MATWFNHGKILILVTIPAGHKDKLSFIKSTAEVGPTRTYGRSAYL